jgi:hypothetical protein
MWILWARSASPDEICIFKITMLTESHWKVIKRDYLPKFFRPRLDLATYIVITRLIPHNEIMLKKYITGRQDPSWRKDFKQISNYLTDSERWICSCPYFLTNRFFICKHLVNLVKENISLKFFKEVQRQGVYPLLGMKPIFYGNLNQNNIDNVTTEETTITTKLFNSSGTVFFIKKYIIKYNQLIKLKFNLNR